MLLHRLAAAAVDTMNKEHEGYLMRMAPCKPNMAQNTTPSDTARRADDSMKRRNTRNLSVLRRTAAQQLHFAAATRRPAL